MIVERMFSFDFEKFRECTGKNVVLKLNKDTIIKYTFTNKRGSESVVNILVGLVSKVDLDKNYNYRKYSSHFKRKYICCGRIIFKDSSESEDFIIPCWLISIEIKEKLNI